ncbi:MAG TPA: hypothetical protein VGF25_22785 [Thermoleophilaceae bacterium]
MFPANAYCIRFATAEDAETISRLTERGSAHPPAGRLLVGEIGGKPAAALSMSDDRVVADQSQNTRLLVATMRMRARAIRAYEATPSLRERILAALPAAA